MASQEQLLMRQATPPNISQCLWDINLEDSIWICRGKININVWFLEAATSNAITRVLQLMRRNCRKHLNRFIAEQRQPILFTVGIAYKVKTRNGLDPHFFSYCASDKFQPEISLWQEGNNFTPMVNFDRDYEFAAMNLIQKFFQQLSHPVLRGCSNIEITSFSLRYKTLKDEVTVTTNDSS